MSSSSLQNADLPASDRGLSALLTHAGLALIEGLSWIRITGEDRVRWLNGMVTNSIQSLTLGQGCYNFILSAQGRIQGDGTAFLLPDSILLETDRVRLPELIKLLDRFIIMDDVELQRLDEDSASVRQGLLLAGPHASTLLAAVGLYEAAIGLPKASLGLPEPAIVPMHLTRLTWQQMPVDFIRAHSPLIPRFELWAAPGAISALIAALLKAGAAVASPASVEHLRLLEGTALYGTDIRDRELPQETAPAGSESRALHFSKGCYLGQEIVERIRSRGNVHRAFSGFILTGELPPPGTMLASADAPAKSIGELTSVARISLPEGDLQLALGYIQRDLLARSSVASGPGLTYSGGTAAPASLPFLVADLSQTKSSSDHARPVPHPTTLR